MIGLQGKTLHSRRLSFRLLEEGDRESLLALLQDPAVTAPAGFMPPVTPEEQENFWQGLTRNHTGVAILLEDRCIGYYHVNPCRMDEPAYRDKKNVMLGIVIGGPYQRCGYGKETVLAMNDYLLERFDCIWGDSFSDNPASHRLFLSCGFREEAPYDMAFEELGGETKHIRSHVMWK